MDKNIKEINENLRTSYLLVSSDNLKLPSFVFETEEEALLALSIIKIMKMNNQGNDYSTMIKYIFRSIGFKNSWTE